MKIITLKGYPFPDYDNRRLPRLQLSNCGIRALALKKGINKQDAREFLKNADTIQVRADQDLIAVIEELGKLACRRKQSEDEEALTVMVEDYQGVIPDQFKIEVDYAHEFDGHDWLIWERVEPNGPQTLHDAMALVDKFKAAALARWSFIEPASDRACHIRSSVC